MRKPTPDTEVKVVIGMIALLVLPAALALHSVEAPVQMVMTSPNPSPLGYTWSLLLFAMPVTVLAWWWTQHPEYKVERRAFWVTIFMFTLSGIILDTLFGQTFFTFENPGSTLGIYFPGYDFQHGWAWDIPLEEFAFYLFGGLYMLLVYIWGDLYWFAAYSAEDYKRGLEDIKAHIVSPHPRSALLGIVLIAAAILIKRYGPHPYQVGFPSYFTLLVVGLFLPSFVFFPTIKPFVNWRAFSFGVFSLLLVSLLWEVTLGIPYRWWGYRHEHMLGLTVRAWGNLPVEAIFLWLVASWATVTVYEVLRIRYHEKRSRITLSDYVLTTKLYQGTHTAIYRARRKRDDAPVIVKTLRSNRPPPQEVARLAHEFLIARSLPTTSVAQPSALEQEQQRRFLIFEEQDAVSLRSCLDAKPMDPGTFLQLAVPLARAVGEIHQRGIFHQAITPDHILIHPDHRQMWLIDFGGASLLPEEYPPASPPPSFPGALAYLSPEQSGRMNRAVDERTDLYSLGVTFYEMLTGRLPFTSPAPLELLQSHLARLPLTPEMRHAQIPPMVGAIVMKLLAKYPEERYQSAAGLQHDLERCQTAWEASRAIPSFLLGEQDRAVRFHRPQRLYGREAQVATLLATFGRVSQGVPEMLIVSGQAGVGKRTLIHELHRPILQQQGYFIQGAFDPLRRDSPYLALIQAFRDLLRQIRWENNPQWQEKISALFGSHAPLVSEFLPELEWFIDGPPARSAPADPSAPDLQRILLDFLALFARRAHPLVIFLDEFQWADEASLDLLRLLMTEASRKALLVVAACREEENPDALAAFLDEAAEKGLPLQTIALAPLVPEQVAQMVAEAQVGPLADVVFTTSRGNPLFAGELLRLLRRDGATAHEGATPSTLSALLRQQLEQLPDTTQGLLTVAAALGTVFDLPTLALAADKSPSEVAQALWPALLEGWVLPREETYRLVQAASPEITQALADTLAPTYCFRHATVREAAYGLLTGVAQEALHQQVGQRFLARSPSPQQAMLLFEILAHLNQGSARRTDTSLRDDTAWLNLLAGQKAQRVLAHAAALRYFGAGIRLLGPGGWQSEHELMLALHLATAESAAQRGDLAWLEQLTDVVRRQSGNAEARARMEEIKLNADMVQRRKLETAGYSSPLFLAGKPLPLAERELIAQATLMRRLAQPSLLLANAILRQTILNLRAPSPDPCLLVGECFDEVEQLPLLANGNERSTLCLLYLCKSMLCYLLGNPAHAVLHAQEAERDLGSLAGTPYVPGLHYFYQSLALLAAYPLTAAPGLLEKVAFNQQRLHRWVASAPTSYEHKYYLVEAEHARVRAKHGLTLDSYERAIALARERGHQQDEALASELLAHYYRSQEMMPLATRYLADARSSYLAWGAVAKVAQLEATGLDELTMGRDSPYNQGRSP